MHLSLVSVLNENTIQIQRASNFDSGEGVKGLLDWIVCLKLEKVRLSVQFHKN